MRFLNSVIIKIKKINTETLIYKYKKCCMAIRLMFQKELMLVRQNASKECDICHYWYFLDKGFKYE